MIQQANQAINKNSYDKVSIPNEIISTDSHSWDVILDSLVLVSLQITSMNVHRAKIEANIAHSFVFVADSFALASSINILQPLKMIVRINRNFTPLIRTRY